MRRVVAGLLLCGCQSSGPAVDPLVQQRLGAKVGHRAPVVDGRRDACLRPPYVPAVDAGQLADGTPVIVEDEGRRWQVIVQDGERWGGEDAQRFVDRMRARPGMAMLSFGAHCQEALNPCFRLEVNLCEAKLEGVVGEFRDALAAEGGVPGAVTLRVGFAGRLGPRCTPPDPDCLPIPYGGGEPRAVDRREAGPLPEYSAGECSHDGDCLVGGCGNHCTSWHYGAANESSTCEGYAFAEPVYCGCVNGSCGWFTGR